MFVPVVTVEEFLRKKNIASAYEQDDDGWFPLHHAIQDTMKDAGLLDVVMELARGMSVEAFDPYLRA